MRFRNRTLCAAVVVVCLLAGWPHGQSTYGQNADASRGRLSDSERSRPPSGARGRRASTACCGTASCGSGRRGRIRWYLAGPTSARISTIAACGCSARTWRGSCATARQSRSSGPFTRASPLIRIRRSTKTAHANCSARASASAIDASTRGELVVLPLDAGGYALAWRIRVVSRRDTRQYFVSARTGGDAARL